MDLLFKTYLNYSSGFDYYSGDNTTVQNAAEVIFSAFDNASDFKSSIENATASPATSPVTNGGNAWEAGKIRILLYTLIFLLGVCGNFLVILTLVQNLRMRTVTNIFLLNLAVSDLLLGVFCMPFTLVGTLLRDFIFGRPLCKLVPFLQAVSVSVSGWTLVAISVERFYAICHPLSSRKWQTIRHARTMILLVWLFSMIAMSPIAVLSDLQPLGKSGRHKCRESWPDVWSEQAFNVLLDVFLLVVPLIVMAAMYLLIVRHLYKVDHARNLDSDCLKSFTEEQDTSNVTPGWSLNRSLTFRRQTVRTERTEETTFTIHKSLKPPTTSLRRCNPGHCLQTKRRVLKMLFVVVLEFFVCWTPLYVVNTLSLFNPSAVYEGLGYTGVSLVQLLAHASCCCNPVTYCFMSTTFRRAFLTVFGCRKKPLIDQRSRMSNSFKLSNYT